MQMFCREYLRDFNATQAAIRAGYSKKTSYSIGEENLRKPEVQEYIEELKDSIINDRESIVLGNIQFWLEVRDDPKSKQADRLKASEYLGKYGAMFTERLEANINGKLSLDASDLSDEEIEAKIKEYESKGKD